MNRKREAMNLAVMEIVNGAASKTARDAVLARAEAADVTITEYLWAHAMWSTAAGECVIAEAVEQDDGR